MAKSKGLFAYHRTDRASAVDDGAHARRHGLAAGPAAAHDDFGKIDAGALGTRASDKAVARRIRWRSSRDATRSCSSRTAVGNIVQLIGARFDARSADEGRSFFSKAGRWHEDRR